LYGEGTCQGATDSRAAAWSYTVAGSGENMWFAADALHFVWKKISGDVTLTANIAFIGTGGNAHRKAVLMIRQSLDADSAYADVALHGSGLTSLQAREEKGGTTHEVQSAIQAPVKVRIAKRGDYFYMWLAGTGEELHMAGGSMKVPLHDPFYAGIGVCSHDKDVVEKAVFSNVDVAAPPETAQPVLYSTLETVPLPSGDRRVVYVAAGRLESPRRTTKRNILPMASSSISTQTVAEACRYGARGATGANRNSLRPAIFRTASLAFVSYQLIR